MAKTGLYPKVFLRSRGQLLGHHGFDADPGRVELTPKGIVFYHYTRKQRLDVVLSEGLVARLPVVMPPKNLIGHYLVEALLEPLPQWMTESPYFGDLGFQMLKQYVGDVLLRIEVPRDFPGLYVADYAHMLESKYFTRTRRPALNLGYTDLKTGKQVCRADANSYIPALLYQGGHVAPEMKVTREGQGIAVPPECISVSEVQPLLKRRELWVDE